MKTLLVLFVCSVAGIAENALANDGEPASM